MLYREHTLHTFLILSITQRKNKSIPYGKVLLAIKIKNNFNRRFFVHQNYLLAQPN